MRNSDTSFMEKWPAFVCLQDRIKKLETIGMKLYFTLWHGLHREVACRPELKKIENIRNIVIKALW